MLPEEVTELSSKGNIWTGKEEKTEYGALQVANSMGKGTEWGSLIVGREEAGWAKKPGEHGVWWSKGQAAVGGYHETPKFQESGLFS